MSSNNVASAALAASAAFKSSHTQHNQKRNTKPHLRLAINTDVNSSRASLAAAQLSQLRSQKIITPTASRPAKSPIGPLGVVKNYPRRTSTVSDDDASSMILQGTDYFSIPRVDGSSGNSDLAMSTPYRLRTNVSIKPQDMLEQVRQSINSKSKVGVGKDLNRKSQLAIDQVRQNVDQHRIRVQHRDEATFVDSPSTKSAVASAAALAMGDSDFLSMSGYGPSSVYNQSFLNNSHSSIGTGTSNDVEGPVTPIIKLMRTASLDNTAPKALSNSLSPSPATAPSLEHLAPVSAISLPISSSSNANSPSPIAIPPSPNAVARSNVIYDAYIPVLMLLASGSTAELWDEPKRVHRKPPPAHFNSEDELSLSGHSLNVPASDVDDVEDQKLPIFPDIGQKQKKHKGLFHRKHKKGPSYDYTLLDEDDKDSDFIPSRSVTPVVNNAPVKFKTTMRTVNKRREKKNAFNEDKPWKNHNELDYVSESQKKRYEGLWVSNRGLYMNKVLTRLVGVNYEKDEECESEPKDRILSTKEISEKAAKLSSAVNSDMYEHDIQQLHSLAEADVHELIHGVVVKNLWIRSRLTDEELAAIWEMVDFRKDGTLNKAEFIVGMWLVDQRLYGRKLPKEVPELVWASLGNMGVRVVIKKKRR